MIGYFALWIVSAVLVMVSEPGAMRVAGWICMGVAATLMFQRGMLQEKEIEKLKAEFRKLRRRMNNEDR